MIYGAGKLSLDTQLAPKGRQTNSGAKSQFHQKRRGGDGNRTRKDS
jgi:hypothetical protein